MKRSMITVLVALGLMVLGVGGGVAEDWPPTKQESIDAALKILTLSKKGYVSFAEIDPSPIIFIEPLGWKGLTHMEKVSFSRVAEEFIYGLGQEKHSKYIFVFIQDMTTHDTLAVCDLGTGKIEIKK